MLLVWNWTRSVSEVCLWSGQSDVGYGLANKSKEQNTVQTDLLSMVQVETLHSHGQKGTSTPILHQKQKSMQNVRPETVRFLEENKGGKPFDIGLEWFFGFDTKSKDNKSKNKQVDYTEKLLHSKGNHQQNEKAGTRCSLVHGLGLSAFTAIGPGSLPGRGTKILQAERCGKNKGSYRMGENICKPCVW